MPCRAKHAKGARSCRLCINMVGLATQCSYPAMNKSCWMWISAARKKPQTPKTVCVCVWGRQTESHNLCNSQDWIPRKLIRGSFRTVFGCRSNILLGSWVIWCLCGSTKDMKDKKKKDNAILSQSCLYGWCKSFLVVWHWKRQLVFLSQMRRYSHK